MGKRRREEFLKKYEQLQTVSTAGIITTGKVWAFNKIILDEDTKRKHIYRSNEIYLTLDSTRLNNYSSTTGAVFMIEFKASLKKIMKLICQLVLDQIEATHKYHEGSKNCSAISLLDNQLGRGDSLHKELDIEQDADIESDMWSSLSVEVCVVISVKLLLSSFLYC